MTPFQVKVATEFMNEFGSKNVSIVFHPETGATNVIISNGVNRVWASVDNVFEYAVNLDLESEIVVWTVHRDLPNPAVGHGTGKYSRCEYWIHGKQTNVDCGEFLEQDEKTMEWKRSSGYPDV